MQLFVGLDHDGCRFSQVGRLLGPKNAKAALQELSSLMHLGGDIEASKALAAKTGHALRTSPFTIMCNRVTATLAASRLISLDLCQVESCAVVIYT